MRSLACRPASSLTLSCRSATRWASSARWAAGRSRIWSTATSGASPIAASKTTAGEGIMPRVAPVTGKSDVPAEFHPVVDDVLSVFGQIRGPFSMLLHSPPLAERMLQFVKFNRGGTVVEPRLLSHAILASVRERDAHYVWAAQVNAARRAGVPEATIDLLRAKGDPAGLGEDERDIVTYTRQLVRNNRVDQAVFDRLQKRHGTQWLVELTAFAGYFGMLSGVVNAFEVAAPPDGDKLPA